MGETKMTTRLKRAQRELTEAESIADETFLAMGRAEFAWVESKLDTGSWFEHQQRADTRKACLRDMRRSRNTFRKHLKEVITLRWAVDRLTEDRERRQAVAQRTRQHKAPHETTVGLTAYSAGRFQRWGHDDEAEISL